MVIFNVKLVEEAMMLRYFCLQFVHNHITCSNTSIYSLYDLRPRRSSLAVEGDHGESFRYRIVRRHARMHCSKPADKAIPFLPSMD